MKNGVHLASQSDSNIEPDGKRKASIPFDGHESVNSERALFGEKSLDKFGKIGIVKTLK